MDIVFAFASANFCLFFFNFILPGLKPLWPIGPIWPYMGPLWI